MAAVSRIGVVGCGIMGCGIAEVAAVAGVDVTVCEVNETVMQAGRERLEASLQRRVSAQKMTDSERDAALARMRFSADLDALHDRQFVIEAIVEAEAEKRSVFSTLDRVVTDPDAVLASNTSSFPITKLAKATARPGQVVGMHFFNPVPVLPLVEVTASLLTSEATVARTVALATETLGKKTILSKDRAGFIVNTLLVPFLLSAIRMLDGGFATAEDIDAGMVLGCAHPMGPLALTDLVGLDTTRSIAEVLYQEFRDPAYAPPPLLNRMVEAGLLGRKSGRGFYDYSEK